jgi:hypothetical protein
MKVLDRVVLVDFVWLHAVLEKTKEQSLNFKEFYQVLRRLFSPMQAPIALVAIDPSSEGQTRFLGALSAAGFLIQADSYKSLGVYNLQDRSRPPASVETAWLAYLLGTLSSTQTDVVIVTGDFGVYPVIRDFITRGGGKLTIAYISSMLDPRWVFAGLLSTKLHKGVSAVCLDEHMQALLYGDEGYTSEDSSICEKWMTGSKTL